jgi:hypothetical protein
MAKFILISLLFLSLSVQADLFDFVSGGEGSDSRINSLIEKMKKIEMKEGPEFEDSFNQIIKGIEIAVEDEKLYCSGESTNSKGKTLPPSQKQLCIRELKKQYLEATNTIFEIKKKYLGFIHQKQIQKLTEIQSSLKSDIEKSF